MMQISDSVSVWGPAFIIKAKEQERRQKAKQSKNNNKPKSKKSKYGLLVARSATLENLVQSGNASEVVNFLKSEPVGAFSKYVLDTCLLQAAHSGDRTVIEGLICHGADVNHRGDNDDDVFGENSPLTICILRGRVGIARLLLENEAEPDYCKPTSRESTLMMAVKSSCAESFVSLLLEWLTAPELDTPDRRGETPLYVALRLKKKRVARMLLENGADVNREMRNGKSARDLATQLGLCDVLGISPKMPGPLTKENVSVGTAPSLDCAMDVSSPSVTDSQSGDAECDGEDEEVNTSE